MSKEWVVMFVDMQGSTEIKYRKNENEVDKIITRLNRVICQVAETNNILKLLGDGAMIGYVVDPEEPHKATLQALRAAVKIIQNIDRINILFDGPPIHILVGIASGQCRRFPEEANDLIGRQVDLAARLCKEAVPDSILVDEATLIKAGLDTNSREPKLSLDAATVRLCNRRLVLKGVPPLPTLERFWDITVDRFANPSDTDLFSNGLVALYLNRDQLVKDFSPKRLIQMAKQGSRMLVAGRTLLSWMSIETQCLVQLVRERDLEIWFMIVSEHALQYLDPEQEKAAKADLIKVSLPYFQKLLELEEGRNGAGSHFRLYKSDLLILDGITCAELCFKLDVRIGDKGEESSDFHRHIALQDINATAQRPVASSAQDRSSPQDREEIAKDKAAILWACTCPEGIPQKNLPCMAHGLKSRTQVLFEKAKGMSLQDLKLDLLLKEQGEGLGTRNNHPKNYLSRMVPYFQCIREGRFSEVPAPVCVQMQVCSRCSTHCRMCDHWIDGLKHKDDELPLDQWRLIFTDLAQFGVRTAIFSGGEPLERLDIADLLRSARRAGLRVGLLSNGIIDKTKQEAEKVLQAIADCADWVAISVDGTETADERIRNLQLTILQETDRRPALIRNFCEGIRARNSKVNLSATVTLQSENIQMKLGEACRFIKEQLTIPQVNFKFATGATEALATPPQNDYGLKEKEITKFFKVLTKSDLPQKKGNNLAYLTRTVDRGVYNVQDIAEGAPVRTYYVKTEFRCFTPFLFSLIDYDGEVYTCCHLYRDNHVTDGKTKDYRAQHSMGNLKTKGFDFNSIWNGPKYAAERKRLTRIDPRQEHFEPCGECTRHCQHNSVLTGVERLYNEAPSEVKKALEELGANYDPVWF